MTGPSVLRAFVALLLVVITALPAAAQHQVVLLHGFMSTGTAWSETADRLRVDFNAAIDAPTTDWGQPFASQAASLELVPALGSSPQAFVGHSNGGSVARHWSRTRPPDTLVTFGTPHLGAPMIPQFWNWYVFNASSVSLLNEVSSSFSRASNFFWILAQVTDRLNWLGSFSAWSVAYLGASLGISAAKPVVEDMRPGSGSQQLLNGPTNLAREASSIRSRVGIVSVARHFYWAGPARGLAPDHADFFAGMLYGGATVVAAWGWHVLNHADPMDLDATRAGLSLLSVAGFMYSIDPVYCAMVSSTSGTVCHANDGIVPVHHQEYPGAAAVYLGFERNDGPAHLQEMDRADIISDVLRAYSTVPPRAPVPPPPGPPPPGPPPPDHPPGSPGPAATVADALRPDDGLNQGQRIVSSDGRFELVYQGDGNLVLHDGNGAVLWNSGTATGDPGVVVMQGDGNLVIYNAAGTPVWASGTHGHPGANLALQTDGNLVIYASDGTALWATNTVQ